MKRFLCLFIVWVILLGVVNLEARAQAAKIRLRVVAEQANIRVKPDIGSEMLWQVAGGTDLLAEKKEGEWYLVTLEKPDGSRIRGYVHESLVEEISTEKKSTVMRLPAEKVTEKVSAPEKTVAVVEMSRVKTEKEFSLFLFGGGSYLSPAELNQAAQGVTDYYLIALNSGKKVSLGGLHPAWSYGLDFFYHFYPQLSLGLGFDYQQGSKYSSVDFTVNNLACRVMTEPELRNLAFRFSLLFQPANVFYFRAGIEVSLARLGYLYRVEQGDSWMEWRGRASGFNAGWMEAAGILIPVTTWLEFYVEGAYRYVRIKNFEGTNYYSDSDGLQKTEKGKLYYWTVNYNSRYYSALFVRDRLPTDPGVLDPREASVNLSGFTLRAGVRLSF
ncbi:MAG: hypothetical protein QME28_03555 [Candidatus Saccharicenans sp.]|nr:hypothetical protein [Candidatus Saccharicenans sp.]